MLSWLFQYSASHAILSCWMSFMEVTLFECPIGLAATPIMSVEEARQPVPIWISLVNLKQGVGWAAGTRELLSILPVCCLIPFSVFFVSFKGKAAPGRGSLLRLWSEHWGSDGEGRKSECLRARVCAPPVSLPFSHQMGRGACLVSSWHLHRQSGLLPPLVTVKLQGMILLRRSPGRSKSRTKNLSSSLFPDCCL